MSRKKRNLVGKLRRRDKGAKHAGTATKRVTKSKSRRQRRDR